MVEFIRLVSLAALGAMATYTLEMGSARRIIICCYKSIMLISKTQQQGAHQHNTSRGQIISSLIQKNLLIINRF